jgi:hypothetical protein
LVRIGPTAWPFTGFIHTYIHTDRQLDKYILDWSRNQNFFDCLALQEANYAPHKLDAPN